MDNAPRNDALEALRGLWRRRRRPALLVFVFLVVPAAALVFALPSMYQAQATILVERESLPPTVSRPNVSRIDEIDTRIRALGQETVGRARLSELIDKYDLYAKFRGRESAEQIIRRMRTDLTVSLDKKTQGDTSPTVAVTVAYRGPNPKTVADVVNSLAAAFVEGRGDERMRQAASTAEMLQAQLQEVRKKMDAQERALGAYKARHNTDLPEQLPANIAALQRLNQQLQMNGEWQIRAAERKDAIQRAATMAATGGPGDSPELQAAKLRTELENLRSRYSESHPDVTRIKGEIQALQKLPPTDPATAPAPASTKAIDSELAALRQQEAGLRGAISSYQSRVEAAPSRDSELQQLTRDYEATKELYDSLYQRETEARLAGRLEEHQAGERFRILDPAVAPTSPQGPNRFRLLAVAIALAFGAAAGTALLLERVDTTFHSLDQLRIASPVPVIGSLPKLRTTTQTVRHGLLRFFGAIAGAAALVVLAGATYWLASGNEALSSLALRLGS